MSVDSLSAHSRRLRLRSAYQAIQQYSLQVLLTLHLGMLIGFAVAGFI